MNADTYTEQMAIATNVFQYLNAEGMAVSCEGEWSAGRWVAAKQVDSEVTSEIVFAVDNTAGGAGFPVVAEFALINGKIVHLSKLHIDVIGGYEYYYSVNGGDVYAAPLSNAMDVRTEQRIGRFEAPQHMARTALKFARESMAVNV